MKILKCTLSFALLAVLAGCEWTGAVREGGTNSTDSSAGLVLCPGATESQKTNVNGSEQLTYSVVIEYPADRVVSCISERLGNDGWKPLKEDFWNPGLASSHVRGWTHFVDSTVHPDATVDQWNGQWMNATGDIVWYSLRYVYPPGDRRSLTVSAGHIPAEIAKKAPKTPQAQK